MKCPDCSSTVSSVLETRRYDHSNRRRRECLECGYRWTTMEIHSDEFIRLLKVEQKFQDARVALEDL